VEDLLLLDITSTADPAFAALGRHRVVEVLPPEFGDRAGEAGLIASELVTNAVEHATTDIELRVRHCGSTLRIEVDDDGSGWPVMREPDLREEGGRGLRIVDGLSDRWGADRRAGDGKTIWAEITLAESIG
jgi:two-component sensor histidine kinase